MAIFHNIVSYDTCTALPKVKECNMIVHVCTVMYTSPCSGSTPSSPPPHRTEGGGGWNQSTPHLPQSCVETVEWVRKG